MYYQPEYFKVEELVPPDLFKQYGRDCFYFLDDRITVTLDRIRKYFNVPITVNTWADKKPLIIYTQRGYRNDPTIGASFSGHRFGRAVDFDIRNITSEEFRIWASNKVSSVYLEWITRIENGTTWNHIDCMGPPKNGHAIIFFNK